MSESSAAFATPASAVSSADAGRRRSALSGGIVGNFVDQVHIFLPLATLAPALPALAGKHASAQSATFVIIAMMLGRPLGSVIFGRLSDVLGRTRTTQWAILGTVLCTAGIALVPTHAVLGAGTLWLILALRFLGGVFIAGEYSAAIPLAMEWSKPRHRGLFSGLIMAMSPLAQGSVALLTWALLKNLDPAAYAAWGWRVSFALGVLASLAMLVFYRRNVRDHGTPLGKRIGLGALMTGPCSRSFWSLFLLMTGLWFMTNMTVVVLPKMLAGINHLNPGQVSLAIATASFIQAVAMAACGHVATLTGRRQYYLAWGVFAAVAGALVWLSLTRAAGLASMALLAGALQAVTVAGYGPIGAYLSEGFPAAIRSSGYGMAYSVSIIVPALSPFYLPPLVQAVGAKTAVAGVIVLGGVLVTLGAALGPRVSRLSVHQELEELQPSAELAVTS